MQDLQRVIAVDWSGRLDQAGQRRHIWSAVWTRAAGKAAGTASVQMECGRTREELVDWLIGLAAGTPRLVVGLDCCFSYPAWFLEEHGCRTAPELWRAVAAGQGERWLARDSADHRFWGRPKKRPEEFSGDRLHRMLRRTDVESKIVAEIRDPARAEKVRGIAPKSPFQIGGSGSVGTGTLRAMPHLLRMREAGFSIWPFDPAGFPMGVEIYSRLMTGPVHKRSAESRAEYLKRRRNEPLFAVLSRGVLARARGSEDAFDALISCLRMVEFQGEFLNLRQAEDPVYRLEGQTWTPGVQQE